MNSKTDKEDRSCDDIAFLSEIIADSRFWQDNFTSESPCPCLSNCYNVVLYSKFLTMMTNSSKFVKNF